MLLVLTILTGAALFSAIRLYSQSNKVLPPLSTGRGKESRIVIGAILVLFVALLVLNATKHGLSRAALLPAIIAFVLGATVPIIRYIQFKNKRKKK